MCICAVTAVVLLGGCGRGAASADALTDTSAGVSENIPSGSPTAAPEAESEAPETIVSTEEIEYSFPADSEDWRLELYTEETEGEKAYRIRMYDGQGALLQDFPCDIEADELKFRWGELYPYADLAVFPKEAQTDETEGLLFLWNDETDRFTARPITIPWYDEAYGDGTFLTTDMRDGTEEHKICCINQGSRRVVELRQWTMEKDKLLIWDCLEKMAIYRGEVKRDDSGELLNGEYYEDLFRGRLHLPWNVSAQEEIPVAIVRSDTEDDWDLETKTYESREQLLEESGFSDAEPFYQYYDRMQNLELELYLDESAGRCCGFCYSYEYNYALEKIVQCSGFLLEGIDRAAWDDDTYSVLAGEGEDAAGLEGVTQVNTGYTDDDRLSYYEVKGIREFPVFSEEAEEERTWVSIRWIYRDDGTLYCKYYVHDPMVFSTFGQTRQTDYDQAGRPIHQYEYITHGAYESYYIYDGKAKRPKYGLVLDNDGGYMIPVMLRYR